MPDSYLFDLVRGELLYILQLGDTLSMAVVIAEEITGTLFQQVDNDAQSRQAPVGGHWRLGI